MPELLLALLLQAAATAPAPPPAAPSTIAAPAAAEAPAAATQRDPDVGEIVRCRRISTIGTRIQGIRCTSLRHDREQRANARQQTERMLDAGRQQNPPGS
jgi:hypothetical protein